MAAWISFLSVGGTFFLMMCVAYGAHMKRRSHVHHEFLQGKHRPNTDVRSAASGFGIDPLRGMRGEPNQVPSSVYRGRVCFFDSVEHRDMFEANQHRPVAVDSALVASQEQHGRRIQRQGAR